MKDWDLVILSKYIFNIYVMLNTSTKLGCMVEYWNLPAINLR